MLLALIAAAATAASLDSIEVCGAWGTPATTDASALWWNPAGLARPGSQVSVEVAPTVARVQFDRLHARNGGEEDYRFFAVVPCAAARTDFGVPGLGVGVGVFIPMGAGLESNEEFGPGVFALQDGEIRAIHPTVGAAYELVDGVSVGAAGALVFSSYAARLGNVGVTDVLDEIAELQHVAVEELGYDNSVLEDPRYNPMVDFGPLNGSSLTFGAGVRVEPVDAVTLSLAYQHGWRIAHHGGVEIHFDCPPQDDILGRFAYESSGLCRQTVTTDGAISYAFPSRIHVGVAVRPLPALRLEAMGAWVGWGAFSEFDIQTTNPQGDELTDQSRGLLVTDRPWARDNVDTFWAGLDGKVDIGRHGVAGGRVLYDRSAVPDAVLSPNNYDANAVYLSALAAVRPMRQLEIGLSFTHRFLARRAVPDSAFGVAIDPDERNDGPYYYASTAGTYRASIERLGISVRGRFGDVEEER